MVGDHLFDVLTGRAAGTKTVLLVGDHPNPDHVREADHVIRRLTELLPLIDAV
jgi:phosphoglycolate phosphatase-like HAD superfamily hydrolase